MENRVAVAVRDVTRVFPNGDQELKVLSGVNLDVEAGTQLAIRGESGSGKSTLLGLIAGLDRPDSGSVTVGDTRIDQLDDAGLTRYRSLTVGLVFQFHYLLRDFTVLENVLMPAMLAARADSEAAERGRELLAHVGLADRHDALPPQLSGGERQRVALARALIQEPQLILADEPTGNLDERNSRLVEELLLGLVRDQGRTLILVTHSSDLADRTGRTMILEHGCLHAT